MAALFGPPGFADPGVILPLLRLVAAQPHELSYVRDYGLGMRPVPGLDSCRALGAYDDVGRRAVVGLKNRDERARITELAAALAVLVPEVPGLVVTWAPTSAARRRTRGFDQAELLARAVARRAGLHVVGLLTRRPGPPQAGRSGPARRSNPAFAARRRCVDPVLLVDDVTTTGATLTAAAEALRAGGAPAVHGLVVARAPAPGGE